jgi:hypothetical protein
MASASTPVALRLIRLAVRAARCRPRMEALGGIDVADADHQAAVHQQRLDRRAAPRVAAYSQSPVKSSDRGSMPSPASSGMRLDISRPSCQSSAPKRRGSRRRRTVRRRAGRRGRAPAPGVAGGTRRRLPDMPRCRISQPPPRRSRSRTADTCRAAGSRRRAGRRAANRGRRESRAAVSACARPRRRSDCCDRKGSNPCRLTSTSGSSGIAATAKSP